MLYIYTTGRHALALHDLDADISVRFISHDNQLKNYLKLVNIRNHNTETKLLSAKVIERTDTV